MSGHETIDAEKYTQRDQNLYPKHHRRKDKRDKNKGADEFLTDYRSENCYESSCSAALVSIGVFYVLYGCAKKTIYKNRYSPLPWQNLRGINLTEQAEAINKAQERF